MTDSTHLASRIPDGLGHPAEADRRHAANVAAQHLQLTAMVYVRALAAGNEGAAAQHLNSLEHDPESGIDPWRLVEAVAAQALRAGPVSRDG